MPDKEVYTRALGGDENDSFVSDRVQAALREHASYRETLASRAQCLAFLGERFRTVLRLPSYLTDVQVCARRLVRSRSMNIHLNFLQAFASSGGRL